MTPEQLANTQAERRRKIEAVAAEIQREHPVLREWSAAVKEGRE